MINYYGFSVLICWMDFRMKCWNPKFVKFSNAFSVGTPLKLMIMLFRLIIQLSKRKKNRIYSIKYRLIWTLSFSLKTMSALWTNFGKFPEMLWRVYNNIMKNGIKGVFFVNDRFPFFIMTYQKLYTIKQ